jgi:hypothetical protein
MSIQEGGFIGGSLLQLDRMTALTLAHELRVRLAHCDPVHGKDATGEKLRNGESDVLIKQYPNAKLAAMCDDECAELRSGLKKLGIIKEDPVDGKEYEIKLYVGQIDFHAIK